MSSFTLDFLDMSHVYRVTGIFTQGNCAPFTLCTFPITPDDATFETHLKR